MKIFYTFLIVFLLSLPVNADQLLKGRVVGVSDGDTITVIQANKKQVKIRVYGIDTPEMSQDFGKRAKKFTSGMVYRKNITAIPMDMDKYGRTVALVYVDGKCLNEMLIENGYAWVYTKYCKDDSCKLWKLKEQVARNNNMGLWADSNPIPPWDYRKSNRNKPYMPVAVAIMGKFHGNTSSKVFHQLGCEQFNCKNCIRGFNSRKDAIREGYRPCGICRP